MSSSSEPLGLESLIRRVARELRVAAAMADDVQGALYADEPLRTEVAIRLQGLDLLSQQLVELGAVLDRVASAGLEGPARGGPLDDVRLSDLKRRLAGVEDGARSPHDAEIW